MLQLPWIVGGVIIGMLISTVIVPPTRKVKRVPQPHDGGVYHTDTGCVRFDSTEVPCTKDTGSFNLLASLGKK